MKENINSSGLASFTKSCDATKPELLKQMSLEPLREKNSAAIRSV